MFYEERLSYLKIFGILMALTAVYLTSVKEKVKTSGNSANWLAPILLFFGSGSIDVGLKYLQTRFVEDDSVPLFSAAIFGCAFVSGFFILIFQKTVKRTVFEFKNMLAGIVLGIPNYFSIFYLLKAIGTEGLESSSTFTLNNVGIVVVSTFFGLLLFKTGLLSGL